MILIAPNMWWMPFRKLLWFKPPLKCENPLKFKLNYASKLMYTEDAISELNKMDKINVIIKYS